MSEHGEPFPRGRGGGGGGYTLLERSRASARRPRRPTAHAHSTVLTVSSESRRCSLADPAGYHAPEGLVAWPTPSEPPRDRHSLSGEDVQGQGEGPHLRGVHNNDGDNPGHLRVSQKLERKLPPAQSPTWGQWNQGRRRDIRWGGAPPGAGKAGREDCSVGVCGDGRAPTGVLDTGGREG